MSYCAGVDAGMAAIKCLSQSNGYVIGYALVFLTAAVMLFRLAREPAKEQMTAALFVTSVVGMLLAVLGWLPSHSFEVATVLFIGAAALLIIRS